MVYVVLENGEFNITNELYESIMKNNPSLLLEKKHKKNKKKQKSNKSSVQQQVNDEIVDNSIEQNGEVSDGVDDYMTKNGKQHFKELTKRFIDKKKDDLATFRKKEMSDVMNLSEKDKLEYYVNNTLLHKEIQASEQQALRGIKYIKSMFQKYYGIMGSDVSPRQSVFSDDANKTSQEDKDMVNGTDDGIKVNTTAVKGQNTDIKANDTKPIDKFNSKENLWRSITSDTKLAFGGFKFLPYFGDGDISGKALRYFQSSNKNVDDSYIDDMINLEIKIKTGTYKIDNEDEKYRVPFENMVNNFLHNSVYKLLVNSNDETYSAFLRMLRTDDVLKQMFNITTRSTVQQFNTKEEVFVYQDKTNGLPILIIIMTPLFYQGKKMLSKFNKLFTGNNLIG